MKFTKAVSVKGNFNTTFVFFDGVSVESWVANDFPKLEAKYGELQISVRDLQPLGIGDTCFVAGEGSDEFKIVGIVKYEDNRFGFKLDAGWTEGVQKCFSSFD